MQMHVCFFSVNNFINVRMAGRGAIDLPDEIVERFVRNRFFHILADQVAPGIKGWQLGWIYAHGFQKRSIGVVKIPDDERYILDT